MSDGAAAAPWRGVRRRARALLALGALTASLLGLGLDPAWAHRLAFSLSSVEWNAEDQSLEVIHRFHTHHAIDAVARAFETGAAAFDTLESQARLGVYVADRFALRAADGAPIPLEMVGVEVNGDFVFVFQEAPMAAEPATLTARSTILHEMFTDQRNQVNITLGGAAHTLNFRPGDGFKRAPPAD